MPRCGMHPAAVVPVAEPLAVPKGFREDSRGSGLIVPEEFSRVREVMTAGEWKLLTRAINTVMAIHKIRFAFWCQHQDCPDPRIQRIRQPDGGFVLRCGHRDLTYHPTL